MVCTPFQLLATATDADDTVTNVALLLDGSPIAGANTSPVATTTEIDFPGVHFFTARATDDRGATTWATQQVTLVAYPPHWLIAGGFRTNGLPAGGQGVFKLCMAGEAGRSYQVLVSYDLPTTNRVSIGMMEWTKRTCRFLDADAAAHALRFYRVLAP